AVRNPPATPAARATEIAGNVSSSTGSNVQVCDCVKSSGVEAPAIRDGQPNANAMGSFIDGGDALDTVAPSMKVTAECTTDCGWTVTSIRSYGTPNNRWASISSRDLLTRVAEFNVIIRPISHVGCRRACAAVTSASSARVRPRNGPPEAVSTSDATSSDVPARRHWAIAECSESTGTSCP